jgi:hypothetical protein
VPAERDVERAVAEREQPVGRVHEHDPRAVRAVERPLGVRLAPDRVVEAAHPHVVVRGGEAHAAVEQHLDPRRLEPPDEVGVVVEQVVVAEDAVRAEAAPRRRRAAR